MITSRYFSEAEFERCTPPCSLQDMSQEAMDTFDKVRQNVGTPLSISCAYRTEAWDRAKGRSGNSAHTQRCAIDVRCTDSGLRHKIVQAAIKAGITRIGIAKTFVHIDTSKLNTPRVIWLY